ncbi:MAG: DUF3105 domain-containing protein [Gaiellaceae bacterium MAG52_C11]|nr:DUF3105 domain-containing protein [Candidatus Gaiellasilicea maunaloa]
MARKDRVPNPPKRPVQAPQRRSTPTTAADAERRKRLLAIIAASALAALVLVVGFLLLDGGGGRSEAAVLEEAGCTLRSFPAQANESDHSDVPSLTSKPKWNSFPPTSGPHFGQTAVFGSYDEPVPLVQSTHNLEHGAVIIHYGEDVPEAEIEAIRSFYEDDPNGLIVAPLPRLGEKIALTAWTTPEPSPGDEPDRGRGYLAECTEFDESAFSTFVDEHRGKGPERLPVGDLVPGGG